MKNMSIIRAVLPIIVLVSMTFSLTAQATLIRLTSTMDGMQANAGLGTGSMGTGVASMLFDDISNEFTWDVRWSGLTGDVTVAHFHGPALPGVNAGVEVAIDATSNPSSGSAVLSDAQEADLLAGLWYINIHSDVNPGGEIRGQVVVPEPAMLGLMLIAVCGMIGLGRRA